MSTLESNGGTTIETTVESPTFTFVQVNEFQPNVEGQWSIIGNVSWQQNGSVILLTNSQNYQVQISFLSPSAFRVRFRPTPSPDYSNDASYAVVNRQLGSVTLQVTELAENGGTLQIQTGLLTVLIGLAPYGIAVYKDDQLICEDVYERNLLYSNEAVANLMNAPINESYFGFGEKAGEQTDKKYFTMNFFNYDNFTYNDVGSGQMMVPDGTQGGPLNPSGPLYNSIPMMLAVGKGTNNPQDQAVRYSYGIFLDNSSQTFFNMGASDYSDMSGKFYFGALYNDLDYYVMVGTENDQSKNIIADVVNQYTQLTGRAAMPPMYALGYHQGCYGYYNKDILLGAAQAYRNANIPIDGLHIDVDFQDNYRTFTISPEKFPNPDQMFSQLHDMGFKCSTNITGIISANPMDENGNTSTSQQPNTPPYQSYPTRDSILNLDPNNAELSTYKPNAPVKPFIYNTRFQGGESPDLFFANEAYGNNVPSNPHYNPYKSPTPSYPDGNSDLGTYGYYCNLGDPDVQAWWGEQYDYLLKMGLDMVWQDMTDPAVVPNEDNNTPDKTLPLDLMMYDKVSGQYQPHAKIHNTFAINLVEATYQGISKLKSSDAYKNLYNYKKRNFIISRGGFAGTQRYAGIWTGDSASSWDFLQINIPEVLNIGISGLPISGCDIGGFANGSGSEGQGVTNYELFTRWMNCGAFLPWYRNHYDGYTKAFQEPYAYGEPVPTNCRKYINIRYQLLQVFYDAMYECTQTGMPIARSLFLNEINDANVFQNLDDQFFVGQDILVAPVVTQGSLNREVYLPNGSNWYVFDEQFGTLSSPTAGGASYDWYVPLGLVPVYIREGAILPIRELEQYVGQLPVNPLTITVYPGKDSSYLLYLDDKISTAAIEPHVQAYRTTQIVTQTISGGRTIRLTRTHDQFTPAEAFFYIAFMGYPQAPTAVSAASAPLNATASLSDLQSSATNAYFYDTVNQKIVIKIIDTQADITVEVMN